MLMFSINWINDEFEDFCNFIHYGNERERKNERVRKGASEYKGRAMPQTTTTINHLSAQCPWMIDPDLVW